MSIETPLPVGDFIDRLTILDIKSERVEDPVKLRNIERERAALRRIWSDSTYFGTSIEGEQRELKLVNAELWEVEERIRIKEQRGEFDREFIALARSIYRLNDWRARVKRAINLKLGSDLIEEKSYHGQGASP
ncbi:MAG: DUF6165 family protein [Pseudomonadota bacterium]|nr:DUF6165 family protein [Pseudomonadota bacterium]